VAEKVSKPRYGRRCKRYLALGGAETTWQEGGSCPAGAVWCGSALKEEDQKVFRWVFHMKWDRYRSGGYSTWSGTVTGGCECSGLSQGRESKVILKDNLEKILTVSFLMVRPKCSLRPQTPETMNSSVQPNQQSTSADDEWYGQIVQKLEERRSDHHSLTVSCFCLIPNESQCNSPWLGNYTRKERCNNKFSRKWAYSKEYLNNSQRHACLRSGYWSMTHNHFITIHLVPARWEFVSPNS
jgi:hypothetical protein